MATAIILILLVANSQEPAPQSPPSTDPRKEFMDNMSEKAGVERVEGNTVHVGPRFVALTSEQKATFLNMLASHHFELGAEGELRPDQVLTVVESGSGKRIGMFGPDGLSME